jgi:hemoglobin
MNQTLYEKIGGKKTVEKAAHFLYVNILKDDRINRFFEDIDIEKQKRKMTTFLTYIFGGPSLYIGKDMRRAHKEVVAKGLNDEHVDAMMECVSKALTELDIDKETIGEVTKTIEAHRDDVLNR